MVFGKSENPAFAVSIFAACAAHRLVCLYLNGRAADKQVKEEYAKLLENHVSPLQNRAAKNDDFSD